MPSVRRWKKVCQIRYVKRTSGPRVREITERMVGHLSVEGCDDQTKEPGIQAAAHSRQLGIELHKRGIQPAIKITYLCQTLGLPPPMYTFMCRISFEHV